MRVSPHRRWLVPGLLLVAALGTVGLLAQGRFGGGQIRVDPNVRSIREIPTRSTGTPEWTNERGFSKDVFTMARLRYDAAPRPLRTGRGGWTTDLPDADLNLAYRLQQMTSIRVDPDARIVRASDPDLGAYPFLLAVAPGAMALTEEETVGLRNYLRNGGFILMTDFWGDPEWDYVERLFKQILPELHFEELPIEHPLYHCVFNITEKRQVPNINIGLKVPNTTIHHRAIFDAKGRLVALALHNSDDSDGWEREGEDHDYFEQYSEKVAYPLAINTIFYVLTH